MMVEREKRPDELHLKVKQHKEESQLGGENQQMLC